jgi:mannose-6-phosphate isomerase-like protein (cupin superfamily)
VLPELPRLRNEAETSPRLRARYDRRAELGRAGLELVPALDDLALLRDERADASAGRPRLEIRVGLRRRNPFDATLDPDLAPERIPVEEQRRARVLLELATLAARVVREEDQPVLVEALQEHHADRRRARGVRGGDRHRFGRAHGAGRLVEPARELALRIGVQVGAAERAVAWFGHSRTGYGRVMHSFGVGPVLERLRASGGGYEVVHESPGLELGVYVLVAPEPDRQQPHEDDEVYLVLEGTGVLEVEGESVPVEEGTTVFVEAGADHRFTAYEHLAVFVVFARPR